jgi:hypothetical protein
MVVPRRGPRPNVRLQGGDAPMGRPRELLGGQFLKPPLHEVQPGTAGRRQVQHKPRVFDEPARNRGRLVRRVVVQHQMHGEVGRDRGVELVRKRLELLRPVMAIQAPHDLPALQVQGGKPARGPMSLIVMTPAFRGAGP